MHALVKIFIQLCLFRLGPQDVPAAPVLRNLTLTGYLLLGILISLSAQETLPTAVLTSLVDTAMLVILTSALLWFLGKSARLGQTLTALAGCGILLNIVSLPLMLLFYSGAENALLSLLLSALAIWNIMVLAHILRHAISQPLFLGMALALVYVIITLLSINWAIASLS